MPVTVGSSPQPNRDGRWQDILASLFGRGCSTWPTPRIPGLCVGGGAIEMGGRLAAPVFGRGRRYE